jgi:hypothetical protein
MVASAAAAHDSGMTQPAFIAASFLTESFERRRNTAEDRRLQTVDIATVWSSQTSAPPVPASTSVVFVKRRHRFPMLHHI